MRCDFDGEGADDPEEDSAEGDPRDEAYHRGDGASYGGLQEQKSDHLARPRPSGLEDAHLSPALGVAQVNADGTQIESEENHRHGEHDVLDSEENAGDLEVANNGGDVAVDPSIVGWQGGLYVALEAS